MAFGVNTKLKDSSITDSSYQTIESMELSTTAMTSNIHEQTQQSNEQLQLREQSHKVQLSFRGEPIVFAEPIFEDSFVIPQFVQKALQLDPSTVFDSITATAPWTDPSDINFRYRGNELQRQKFFFVDPPKVAKPIGLDLNAPPSQLPKYDYPGFQYQSMFHYRPIQSVSVINDIKGEMERNLKFNDCEIRFNHIIGTPATDNIGYHSDKVKDIAPGTPIVSLSFGETREFHIGVTDSSFIYHFVRVFCLIVGFLSETFLHL
jgi:hypothetical protein